MSSTDLNVRSATTDDIDVLTSFNCLLAEETEGRPLDVDVVRSGVTRGLEAGDEVQYFVAESGGTVVGQLMLTREWSDWRDGWMSWLQSVYVLIEFRGRGVFRQLLSAAMEYLRQHQSDVVALRLYVEQDNEHAMAAYRRLGFHSPGYEVMEMPLDGSQVAHRAP